MNEWSVYKHTTPSGKVYIGITHQKPESRWLYGYGYKYNQHFWRAIVKYGWDNIEHEIIATRKTQAEAEALERELIFKYKSYDREYGYNRDLGGHALQEASRRKIAETRKTKGIKPWDTGKHLSEQTKANIARAVKGNKNHTVWTPEQKESVRQSKLGANNPNYGKPMDEKLKQLLIKLHSKPVVMLVDGVATRYDSAKTAERETGIAACNITRVCKGERMTAGGARWEYA